MSNSKGLSRRIYSIRGRIILSLTLMCLITLSLVIFSNLKISKLFQEKDELLNRHVPAQNAGFMFTSGINESVNLMISFLETGNEAFLRNWEEIWNLQISNSRNTILQEIEELQLNEAQKTLKQFHANYNSISVNSNNIISEIKKELKNKGYYSRSADASMADYGNDLTEANRIRRKINYTIHNEVIPNMQALNLDSKLLLNHINDKVKIRSAVINDDLNLMKSVNNFSAILSVVLGAILAFFLLRYIIHNLQNLKNALSIINEGNIPESLKENGNEINPLIDEINKLSESLRNVKNFALKVGKGEFDHDITVFDNQGELGESLAGMRESLSKVAKEDNQRNWVNEGISSFSELLRRNNDDIQILCDELISSLVKYTKASQGAILLKEEDNVEEFVLELKSCYALNKKKFLKKRIHKGEGLAGQCWQENEVIYLTEVPETYINITSGLGQSSPRCVLIVPLNNNEETVGVLELATFNLFENFEIEFIKKVSESIAASISSTKVNERTVKLLEESQQLTEMMRAQEEEMRQNMEELEATQEEMNRTQYEIRQKESNLNALINNTEDTIFAIDKEYKITVVNQTLKEKYAKMGIELKEGSNIFDVLPKDKWEIWKERYDRSLQGERYTRIEESSGTSGSKFVETHHNPIKDEVGNIIGVSVIARDITQLKNAEYLVKKKESILNAIINSTDDTYFALDTEYRITVANDTLRNRFKESGIELNEGDNIFDKLPKEAHSLWKERYDRALAGETFKIATERKLKDKTLFIEVFHSPIKDPQGNIVGASVMSKDITEWKKALDEMAERDQEISKLKKTLGINEDQALDELRAEISKESKTKV
jgi:PAS domain S-box-containing protein